MKYLVVISLFGIFNSCTFKENQVLPEITVKKENKFKNFKPNNFTTSNSEIKSTWESKHTTKLNCKNKFTIIQDSIKYIFCNESIIDYCDSFISISDKGGFYSETKDYVLNSSNTEIINSDIFHQTFLTDLICCIEFEGVVLKNSNKLKQILIENYTSNISGGINYYPIDTFNDTLNPIHGLFWIQ